MGTRKFLTAAIVALVLLSWGVLAAPAGGQKADQSSPGARSEVIVVQDCQTYWEDERIISSKIQGRIAKRPVKDGQLVKVDEELARLDDREARLEFERQDILGKSDLDEQTQYLKWIEYLARFDAATRLVNKQAIPMEEWRLGKVNVEVNELLTKKEAEKRKIEKNKAEQAEVVLNEHVIRSPVRGFIKECFKREMELVTPSDHRMFHIVATDKVWVDGTVEVRDVYRVKPGQQVEVKLAILEPEKKPAVSPGQLTPTSKTPADGERLRESSIELPQEKIKFYGTIVFIDPDVDFNSRTLRVRAEVDNQYDPETNLPIMRAGMHANMTIYVGNSSSEKVDDQKN